MTFDVNALGAAAAAAGADQTKAQAGGGDYTPPAAGPALVRLVGYVELGMQAGTFQGKPTLKEKVQLIFELVGKRHPPHVSADGQTKTPMLIVVEESLSLNEKANFFKLFQRLNYRQDKQHMVQLVGEGFKAEVIHDKWTDKAGKERVSAVLKGPGGYTLAPPRKEDEDSETGWVDVAVPAALSSPRVFLWNHADMQQWGSLFIDGEYPERKNDKGEVTAPARSKNVYQNKIKQAKNFPGSPIYNLLAVAGQSLDIPAMDEQDEEPAAQAAPSPKPQQNAASQATKTSTTYHSDALGGIV